MWLISKTRAKTNRIPLARVFLRLAPGYLFVLQVLIGSLRCIHLSWLADQSDYFCFGFTTLNWNPLYFLTNFQNSELVYEK